MRRTSLAFGIALLALHLGSCSLEYETSEPSESVGHSRAALGDVYVYPGTTWVDELTPNHNFSGWPVLLHDYWGIGLVRLSDDDVTAIRQGTSGEQVRRAHIHFWVASAGGVPRSLHAYRMLSSPSWEPGWATWNCPQDDNLNNEDPNCDPQWDFKAPDPAARPHATSPTGSVDLTSLPSSYTAIDLDVTGDVLRLLAGESIPGWAVRYDAVDGSDWLSLFPSTASGPYQPYRPYLVVELADDTYMPPECPPSSLPELDDSRITRTYDVTQHLTSGSCAVQTIGPDTIDPQRASHLRGRVVDGAGNPIAGANVTILHHAELGWTRTRSDGWWDLVVNGGGPMTVDIQKTGYFPMQRTVEVPWNDYIVTEQLVLVPQQTTGCLPVSGANGGFYVRPSGSDARVPFGVWIPTNTQARTSPTSTLPSYYVCGAEYTVDRTGGRGELAMPGELPPTSGYTYANELEIRSSSAPADRVESPYFTQMGGSCGYSPTAPNHCQSGMCCTGGRDCNPAGQCVQPVFVYVKDPLGMPVGNRVPSGTYDRSQAAWGASDDGRVVRVVSYGGGCAFDLNGDGVYTSADDTGYGGTAYDQTSSERAAFSAQCGAGLPFQVGDRVWRIPVTHFSAWDFNWGLMLPLGALVPLLQLADQGSPNGQCELGGSVIGCEAQTLGESIPITGTDWALHYQSERQRGRQDRYRLTIPFAGTQVGGGETAIDPTEIRLEIQVAGRRFDIPSSELHYDSGFGSYTFTWDGRDAWGRLLQGAQPVTVRLGYVYPTTYGQPSSASGQSFVEPSNTDLMINARETVFWTTRRGLIGGWDQGTAPDGSQRGQGLGGWSVTPHHVYDARAGVLYRGDGTLLSSRGLEPRISSLYSNTTLGPRTVTVAPDGEVYFGVADGSSTNNRIYRATGSSSAEPFAGSGAQGSTDGAALGGATFQNIKDLAFASDGTLYVLESGVSQSRLRRVRDGQVTTLVSTGLVSPTAIAVGPGSAVYIAEPSADRITVWRESAGSYVFAGGPLVDNPRAIAVAPDGAVLAAVSGGVSSTYLVRRISPTGVGNERYTVVAGGATTCDPVTGNPADGDGAAASAACIRDPSALAVDAQGNLFITQNNGNVLRVRRVNTAGIIDTVAGAGGGQVCSPTPCTPNNRPLGDGGPANAAFFRSLDDLAIGSNGHIYLADSTNYRIREVRPALADSVVGETVVAEPDGSLLYRFDERGRHVRTESGLTGETLVSFSYVGTSGLLQGVDVAGSSTTDLTITRNASTGAATRLVTAWGETPLAMNAQGYLWRATNPAGSAYTATYYTYSGEEGLLQSFDDPTTAGPSLLTYELGRLVNDASPAGIAQSLQRVDCGTDCRYIYHSYDGQSWSFPSIYGHTQLNETVTRFRMTPLGAWTEWHQGDLEGYFDAPIGTGTNTERLQVGLQSDAPDGTRTRVAYGTDPRPGLDPMPRVVEVVRAPSNVTTTVTDVRSTVPATPTTISEVTQMTDVLRINGTRRTERILTIDDGSSSCRTQVVLRTPLYASSQGVTVTACYDAQERMTSLTIPGLEPIAVTYEATGGRPSSITQGARRAELSYLSGAGYWEPRQAHAREYVSGGWTTRESTTFTRNSAGFETAVQHQRISPASSSTIALVPDQVGRTTQLTTPLGRVHQQAFTPRDVLSRYTPPNLSAGSCTNGTCPSVLDIPAFDAAHRPQQLDVRNGPTGAIQASLGFTYDATHGYLSQVSLPASDGRVLTITRNTTDSPGIGVADGRISAMSFDGTTLAYEYDGPFLQDEQWSGANVAGTVRHVTDAFGELDRLELYSTSPTYTVDYTRNEESQITQILTQGSSTLTASTFRTGTGSGEHWERTTTLGNTSSRETLSRYGELDLFEVCNGLSCPSVTPPYRYQVTARDYLGRETARTEVTNGTTESFTYAYDGEGRLQTVTRNGSTVASYTWDANGNRDSATYYAPWAPAAGPSVTAAQSTYDNQDRVTLYGTCSYTYDAQGQWQTRNCGAGAVTSYAYDVLGNLRSVTLPSGRVIQYFVDAQGRRVRRLATGGGVATEDTRWLYGDGLNPVAELNGSNQLRKVFVYASRANVPDYMVDVSGGGAGVVYRLVSDPRGSVRMVIHAGAGAIAQQINYDAFGYVLSDTQPGYQPFGFAGGLYDDETGLVRFGARDYDAITGRWTAKDPAVLDGVPGTRVSRDGRLLNGLVRSSANLYAYAGADPVNYVDDTGRIPVLIGVAIIGGFTGAAMAAMNSYAQSGQIDISDVLIGFVAGAILAVYAPFAAQLFAGAGGAALTTGSISLGALAAATIGGSTLGAVCGGIQGAANREGSAHPIRSSDLPYFRW